MAVMTVPIGGPGGKATLMLPSGTGNTDAAGGLQIELGPAMVRSTILYWICGSVVLRGTNSRMIRTQGGLLRSASARALSMHGRTPLALICIAALELLNIRGHIVRLYTGMLFVCSDLLTHCPWFATSTCSTENCVLLYCEITVVRVRLTVAKLTVLAIPQSNVSSLHSRTYQTRTTSHTTQSSICLACKCICACTKRKGARYKLLSKSCFGLRSLHGYSRGSNASSMLLNGLIIRLQ